MQHEQQLAEEIAEAQKHLQAAESILEQFELSGKDSQPLREMLDLAQSKLVESQLKIFDSMEGQETNFHFLRPTPYECELNWSPSERILQIFIPNADRVDARPSIYIKDLFRYRNGGEVKRFYTRLLKILLEINKENGRLVGYESFRKVFAGFVFHFNDGYIRDPNNYMVKVLIDACKLADIFYTDDYKHLLYMSGGVFDPKKSGVSLFFSDSSKVFDVVLEEVKNIGYFVQNYVPIDDEKLYTDCNFKVGTWF